MTFAALRSAMTRSAGAPVLGHSWAPLLGFNAIAEGEIMARKPRDYDAELPALMERTKKVKTQKTTQLGEIVQITGADALPFEALAGALLAAVEQSKDTPEAVAGWTERGQALFRQGSKRGTKQKPGNPADGGASHSAPAPAAGRAAQ